MADKKGKILSTIIDIAGEISPTLGKTINEVTDKLSGVNKAALVASAAVAAVGAAAITGAVKATKYLADLGDDYNKAVNDIQVGTGFAGEELDQMSDALKNIYANNFGEDFADVADAITTAQQVTGLMGDDLEAVTQDALALRDTFDYDVNESTRAAKALMQNFGVSGEEAMDLIATGAQNGLDFSGEMLDSISEYSVQFGKVGMSAEQMFAIFQSGADGTAWNLDKVGDAVKEFSIRAIDGSDTTIEGFKALGMDADKMMATFAEGGEAANTAFYDVLDALINMEDPVARDAAGVNLLGTMWEDLGVDAVAALADTRDAAYDASGAMETISEVKYDNIGDAFETIKRQAEVSLLPLASTVAKAFAHIAPVIGDALESISPVLDKIVTAAVPIVQDVAEMATGAIGEIAPTIDTLIPILSDAFGMAKSGIGWITDHADTILPILAGITAAVIAYKTASKAAAIAEGIKNAALAAGTTITGFASAATWALGTAVSFLTSPIFLAAAAIGVLVAGGILLYKNWDTIKEKAIEFGAKVSEIWSGISAWIGNAIEAIGQKFPIFGGYLSGWWSSIQAAVENVKNVFSGIISFIDNVFAGNWKAAWENITNVFGNVFGAILNLAKAPLNGVIGAINTVIGAINGISIEVPEWVPGFGGKTFGFNIPSIPTFATGGFTDGVSIAGEAGTEAVISFDPAYRRENLSYWAHAGRLLGAEASDFSLSGASDGGMVIDMGGVTFAPNITITGKADKESVTQAIQDEYPEFLDILEHWFKERGLTVYA